LVPEVTTAIERVDLLLRGKRGRPYVVVRPACSAVDMSNPKQLIYVQLTIL
jgi:hypothetical protein